MTLLDSKDITRILEKLNPEESRLLAGQIDSTRKINNQEASKLLLKFRSDLNREIASRKEVDGLKIAEKLLETAFGEEKAREILARSTPRDAQRPLAFLNDLTPGNLHMLLHDEPAHTLALILSFLKPAQAAMIFKSLGHEKKCQLILRMSQIENVTSLTLKAIEKSLQDRICNLDTEQIEKVDGQGILAQILKFMDVEDEKRIISHIRQTNEKLQMKWKDASGALLVCWKLIHRN